MLCSMTAVARGVEEKTEACRLQATMAARIRAILKHVLWTVASPRPGLVGMCCEWVQLDIGAHDGGLFLDQW